MTIQVTRTGDEPLIAAAVDYLERTYGMSRSHIREIIVRAPVGEPQTITITLHVQAPLAADELTREDVHHNIIGVRPPDVDMDPCETRE